MGQQDRQTSSGRDGRSTRWSLARAIAPLSNPQLPDPLDPSARRRVDALFPSGPTLGRPAGMDRLAGSIPVGSSLAPSRRPMLGRLPG